MSINETRTMTDSMIALDSLLERKMNPTGSITTSLAIDGIMSNILAEFVVIPRSELPEVKAYPSYLHVDGQAFSSRDTPNEHRRAALNCLAIAEHFDAQAATDAKRNARRDELAVELAGGLKSYGEHRVYGGLSTVAKRAIDRIIELEEAAA